MHFAKRAILAALVIVYPLAIYFGLQRFEPKIIGAGIALVFVFRWYLLRKTVDKDSRRQLYPLVISGVGCGLLGTWLNDSSYLKLIPCLINAIFLINFSYTLRYPPSMVERIARISQPDLPDHAIAYTKNVTRVWCCFFAINGSLALYTALYATLEMWTLYNGLLSYMLMGLLFLVEYCVRVQVINKSA